MKTLSLNLVNIIEKLFCVKKEKVNENKKCYLTVQKVYKDRYEDLTLEQQLMLNQIGIGM